jgi:hypothetical protein
VDYKKFLAKTESLVLAYTGGLYVFAKDRRLSVKGPIEPGFWRFDVKGREAAPVERADSELDALPRVRGHFAGEWLFAIGAQPEHVELLPEEEIAPLSNVFARRWHDGDLLYDSTDFDSDAEDAARNVLGEGKGLGDVKGAPASLRAAFGWATLVRTARREEVPVSLGEAMPFLRELADGGEATAMQVINAIEARRNPHRIQIEGGETVDVARTLARMRRRGGVEPTVENAQERAAQALEAAGGRLLTSRILGQRRGAERMEVTFRYGGNRFITVCHPITLQVLDAGICLVDHRDEHRGDEELTLESLPSAIREAMGLGVLVITRR